MYVGPWQELKLAQVIQNPTLSELAEYEYQWNQICSAVGQEKAAELMAWHPLFKRQHVKATSNNRLHTPRNSLPNIIGVLSDPNSKAISKPKILTKVQKEKLKIEKMRRQYTKHLRPPRPRSITSQLQNQQRNIDAPFAPRQYPHKFQERPRLSSRESICSGEGGRSLSSCGSASSNISCSENTENTFSLPEIHQQPSFQANSAQNSNKNKRLSNNNQSDDDTSINDSIQRGREGQINIAQYAKYAYNQRFGVETYQHRAPVKGVNIDTPKKESDIKDRKNTMAPDPLTTDPVTGWENAVTDSSSLPGLERYQMPAAVTPVIDATIYINGASASSTAAAGSAVAESAVVETVAAVPLVTTVDAPLVTLKRPVSNGSTKSRPKSRPRLNNNIPRQISSGGNRDSNNNAFDLGDELDWEEEVDDLLTWADELDLP